MVAGEWIGEYCQVYPQTLIRSALAAMNLLYVICKCA
jgi:hypothetical protein